MSNRKSKHISRIQEYEKYRTKEGVYKCDVCPNHISKFASLLEIHLKSSRHDAYVAAKKDMEEYGNIIYETKTESESIVIKNENGKFIKTIITEISEAEFINYKTRQDKYYSDRIKYHKKLGQALGKQVQNYDDEDEFIFD